MAGVMTMDDLLKNAGKIKKIFKDSDKFEGVKSPYVEKDDEELLESVPYHQETYNSSQQILSEEEEEAAYNEKLLNLKLPDAIKNKFLTKKPLQGDPSSLLASSVISKNIGQKNTVVKKSIQQPKQLMENNQIIPESRNSQLTQKGLMEMIAKIVKPMIENMKEEILNQMETLKEGKESLPKENFSIQIVLGDYLCEGVLKPVKKIK